MLKKERQQIMLDIIKEKQYASVSTLSKLLYASLPTIRRDLTELQKEGLIIRSRGGAMILSDGSYQIPLDFRTGRNTHEKIEMCRKAAKLISDGDVIFIDTSTSTMHIADFITAKNITVITNGMPVAILLAKKNIKTYFIGGEVFPQSLGCGGIISEDIVTKFNYNLVFFSSYGINEKGIVVDTSFAETALRKEVFKTCSKKVFLHTKDKEGLNAPYNLINVKDIDYIIN